MNLPIAWTERGSISLLDWLFAVWEIIAAEPLRGNLSCRFFSNSPAEALLTWQDGS